MEGIFQISSEESYKYEGLVEIFEISLESFFFLLKKSEELVREENEIIKLEILREIYLEKEYFLIKDVFDGFEELGVVVIEGIEFLVECLLKEVILDFFKDIFFKQEGDYFDSNSVLLVKEIFKGLVEEVFCDEGQFIYVSLVFKV